MTRCEYIPVSSTAASLRRTVVPSLLRPDGSVPCIQNESGIRNGYSIRHHGMKLFMKDMGRETFWFMIDMS